MHAGKGGAATDEQGLELVLGHRFARRELLEHALTHSSHANEANEAGEAVSRGDNEQMEFLGDAVLNFVTSRALFERYSKDSEGRLSKIRAHLVSARHLIMVARGMNLGGYLRLGRGEERSGGRQKSALLVDALEALIAALYLDGGVAAAEGFILGKIVLPELERMDRDPEKALAASDRKSSLQEFLQGQGLPQPEYRVVKETGPDHRKTFVVELRAQLGDGDLVLEGKGDTKKKAEQDAARKAIARLQPERPDLRKG